MQLRVHNCQQPLVINVTWAIYAHLKNNNNDIKENEKSLFLSYMTLYHVPGAGPIFPFAQNSCFSP
jgi:hypothetical protein